MGGRPDWDDIVHKFRAAEAAADEAARKQCEEVVLLWNAMVRGRRDPEPSPAISVALTAGYNWLQVFCPACRTVSQVDLSTIEVHPKATLAALIPRLSCSRCRNAPFAELNGVSKFRERPRWKADLEAERMQREYDEEEKPKAGGGG